MKRNPRFDSAAALRHRRALSALEGRDALKYPGLGLPDDAIKLAIKIEAAKRAPRYRLIGLLCGTLMQRGAA